MSAIDYQFHPQILDTSGMTIHRTKDGYFRHVCHTQRLATSGWQSHDAAQRNVGGYRDTGELPAHMRIRYAEELGAELKGVAP